MLLINLLGEIGGAKTLNNKNNEVIMLKPEEKPFKNVVFLPKITFFVVGMKDPKLDH